MGTCIPTSEKRIVELSKLSLLCPPQSSNLAIHDHIGLQAKDARLNLSPQKGLEYSFPDPFLTSEKVSADPAERVAT